MGTLRSLDELSLKRMVDALAAAGPSSAPALVVLRLAIAGVRRRDLYDVTADQVVWMPSAVLRNLPRPTVGIRTRRGSANIVEFAGDCGAWITKRARGGELKESFFPQTAFQEVAETLSREKITWHSLRVNAALELYRRLAS